MTRFSSASAIEILSTDCKSELGLANYKIGVAAGFFYAVSLASPGGPTHLSSCTSFSNM